jgi:hypothetical protein
LERQECMIPIFGKERLGEGGDRNAMSFLVYQVDKVVLNSSTFTSPEESLSDIMHFSRRLAIGSSRDGCS